MNSFDINIFNAIHGVAGRFWFLDMLGIFLAEYSGYFLIVAALIFIIRETPMKKRLMYFFYVALAVIFSRGLIVLLIRFFYYRPRPFLVFNFTPLVAPDMSSSFPSGHAAFYFALAFAILYLNKKVGWWFILVAALMGTARIFVGVHWLSDILAGAVIGYLGVFVVAWLLDLKIFLNKKMEPTDGEVV